MDDRLNRGVRLGVAVLLVAAVALVALLSFPGAVGAESSFIVLSGSMEPTLQPGDVVVVESADPAAVHEGDIIVFHTDGPLGGPATDRVTHRVVEKVHTDHGVAYRTKGDANDVPDPSLVDHSRLVGTVSFHVPFVGLAFLLLSRPLAQLSVVVLPGVWLLTWGVRTLAVAGEA